MDNRNKSTPKTVNTDHHEIKPACPDVPLHGIPDFHVVEEEGDHVRMASMQMDANVKGRVNTGTGEQPSNSGGSRFATDCTSE
ncbi:MAG: hypothetical protein K8H89_16865 [Flavobacteriales bacterium]|jgi:hypothetical protein|nr:hypothetical protein [Flavobacteriales bacterium]MCB0759540.1 hypothetical protein [Flavobacteriales bacterium]